MRGARRGPSHLTSRQKEEIISTSCGINHDRCQVDRLSLTGAGTLTRSGIGLPTYRHSIHTGETPQAEIWTVFHLTDLIEIPSHLWADEYSKRRIAVLEAKAQRMRAEREAIQAKAKESA